MYGHIQVHFHFLYPDITLDVFLRYFQNKMLLTIGTSASKFLKKR